MSNEFNFGENAPKQVEQTSPFLDQQMQGIIKNYVKSTIPELNRVQGITLSSGATTFDVRNSDNLSVSGSVAVSITTITNGYNGQILTLIFNDANVTLVHDATATRNTINLGGANVTGADNTTLQLIFDGTSWYINTAVSLAAIAGTIGGFNIGADYIRDAANSFGLASTVTGGDDVRFWAGDTFANRAIAPGRITESGAATFSSMTITGGSITGTPIASIPNSTATDISLLTHSYSMAFSVTDADTIAWGAGTIALSNGRTFAIDAGNTGNMVALTYIYLDTAVSTTVLQTTTTYSTAMGANKLLVGMAQNNTVTASFIPYGGGQPLIDGANIGALSIVAGNIAASTITAGKLSVAQLSAITADLGTITAGSISVVNAGNTVGFTPAGVNAIFSGPTGTPTFTVTPAGAMTSTSGAIAAFTIAGTTLSATNLTITSGAANTANIVVGTGSTAGGLNSANSGTDIAFWAGSTFANRATAPFRVNAQGDLIATSVTTLSIPKILLTTNFEDIARFSTGGTAPTLNNNGLILATSAVAGNMSILLWTLSSATGMAAFAGSPKFSCCMNTFVIANAGVIYVGIGDPRSGGTFSATANHIGFKIVISGGAANLYGTQADGTTENATSSLTTLANTDTLDLICIVNGTTSVDYYWRKNGGSLSTATNLTSNLPTAAENTLSFFTDNQANANVVSCRLSGSSYER